MYLVLAIATTLICYAIHYYKWWKDVYNNLAKLPGPLRVPLLGTLYIYAGVIREDLLDVMANSYRKYGPLFCFWSGWQPEVHIVKPEHAEIILNTTTHNTKGSQYDTLHPFFGEGLVTTTGSRWQQHRKIINPTFHFNVVKKYMEIFVDNTKKLVTILDSKVNGKAFDMHECIDLCALDIVCESMMGVSINAMADKNSKYITSVKRMEELAFWKMLHPYIPNFLFRLLPLGREFHRHINVAKGLTEIVLRYRKEALKNKTDASIERLSEDYQIFGKKKFLSFVDMLLGLSEDGRVLNDEDIKEEVNTFTAAGYDPVSASMSWSLFLLGNHPEVQEKAFAEVRGVIQDKLMPTSLTELSDLKYLECVIKEAMRIFPPVPFITRRLQTDVNIGGNKIPAGVEAFIEIYNIHRDPEYYPDPEKFDPSRFLPENSIGRHAYAFLPFSSGPRNCIGQKFAMYEAKTILATIINRYTITAMEKTDKIKRIPEITLRPMEGVFVTLERRK